VSAHTNAILKAKIRNMHARSQMSRMSEEGKNKTKEAMHRATVKRNLNRFHMNNPPDPAYPLILQPSKSKSRNRESVALKGYTFKRQLPARSVSLVMRMSTPNKNRSKIVENV
jgi:hypothetical protein